MALLRRTSVPEPSRTVLVPRCEACHRTTAPLEPATVEGLPVMVCVNGKDCRQHWPAEDRR